MPKQRILGELTVGPNCKNPPEVKLKNTYHSHIWKSLTNFECLSFIHLPETEILKVALKNSLNYIKQTQVNLFLVGFCYLGPIVELAEGRNPREYCQLLLHNNEICFMASAVGKQALMVWE